MAGPVATAAAAGQPSAVPAPTGDAAMIATFFEVPCLLLYAYFLSATATWVAWAARRAAAARRLRGEGPPPPRPRSGLQAPLLRKAEKPTRAPLLMQRLVDAQGRTITFVGYRDSAFGSLASAFVPSTSVVLLSLFVLLLADYYHGCAWQWPEYLCYIGDFPILGDFDANSRVFLVVWIVSVSWFGALVWGRGGQLDNMFRLHATLHSARYVHITVGEQEEVISSGYSRALHAWRRASSALSVRLGLAQIPAGAFGLSGGHSQTVELRYNPQLGAKFVTFRCTRYILDLAGDGHGGFVQYDPTSALHCGHAGFLRLLEVGGLGGGGQFPSAETIFRQAGPNSIPFEVDSWGTAVAEEFSTFFFLYQFSVYAVCMWFSYWHYTIAALAVAFSSGFFNVRVRLASQRELARMMAQTSRAVVLRGGREVEVDAEDIVPGDIVKVLGNGWMVPCDMLLLRGAAICDESTLTGESMPVQRLAPTEPLQTVGHTRRFPVKHVLTAGTTVLLASDEECWAVATHTGIYTQKGQLLLLILYPPRLVFKYDEQLVLVFSLLLAYAIFVMVASMKIMYSRYATSQQLPFTAMWASGVFIVSCVLPTMLHVVLSVGSIIAAERLQRAANCVYCAAPKRLALGGKVRVACFDKTGTLTESSLRFFGVHCARIDEGESESSGPFNGWLVAAASASPSPLTMASEPTVSGWSREVACGLASAHSLSPFDGSESRAVGNVVEVSMFQAVGWRLLSQSQVAGPCDERLHILKRFDFSHQTMTMSAVVEHHPSGGRGSYCKGSFEQVARRCLPSSVPCDLASVAQAYTFSGKYVLALAGRALPRTLDWHAMTREDTEKDLVMIGLLLFENPLRPDSRDAVERLRDGEVRCVMITGDAPGTAICIAREAALVAPGVPVLLGDLLDDAHVHGTPLELAWKCQGADFTAIADTLLGNEWLTWQKSLKKELQGDAAGGPAEEPGQSFSTEEVVVGRLFEWCELAVTERAWEWLQRTSCSAELRQILLESRLATLKKGRALSRGQRSSSLAWELLTNIRIFARMTPAGKITVVEGLMSQGLITAMTGDGGNDSGALRAAHVGMALSAATSATVVAPFTTNRQSVMPLVDLLLEGRAGLATSFAGYKYVISYGLLSSTYKLFASWNGVCQSMAAHYFQDLLGFLTFSWALSLSKPTKSLTGDRPTSSLFSLVTAGSVVGMWVINCLFLCAAARMVMSHEDFVPFPIHAVRATHWWKRSRSWETTTVFFMYTFQQFWSAIVFSFGHTFRKGWYKNMVLSTLALGGMGFLAYLLLAEVSAASRAFQLSFERDVEHDPWSRRRPLPPMPYGLRCRLFGTVLLNLAAVAAWEHSVVHGVVGRHLRSRWRTLSKHVTLRL